ncbi:hypothetical protein [Roseburia faecis]|uniref:hypothetical protein n=1 Tax=Roseburia faecis TaxID=301302 RepID=UPI003F981AA5
MIKNNKGKKYLKIWLLIALTKLVECILNFFPISYFPVFVIVFIFTMIIEGIEIGIVWLITRKKNINNVFAIAGIILAIEICCWPFLGVFLYFIQHMMVWVFIGNILALTIYAICGVVSSSKQHKKAQDKMRMELFGDEGENK